MSSKVFLLICLSMAFAALIISEVAVATELAETSAESLNNEEDSAKGVEDSKYPGRGGYGGYPGGGYGGYPGGGYGGYPGGGYGRRGGHGGRGGYGGGGRCRYGCCGRGHRGCRCCSYAGEAVDAEPLTQP